jgi:NADH-quinone oxidoreductase subunit L
MGLNALIVIPWLMLLAAGVCALCCTRPQWRPLAGWVCVGSLVASFVVAASVYVAGAVPSPGEVVTAMRWIDIGNFQADFAYYIDPLTMVMLFVVTGIGSLVAIYSLGYMKGDTGYARFFAAVALFIFAMSSMVMADNLVLLYLGWEMVGLASFLLIGFYVKKPSAVAAAKKAFIVNRVADLGFALGIFTCYYAFGSVRYTDIIPAAQAMLGQIDAATLSGTAAEAYRQAMDAPRLALQAAPLLLLLGALGKSAQIPFYVWLPDAMEGPSPVSALIHAATMVTSGVYMIARLLPLYEFSHFTLPIVGWPVTTLGVVATLGGFTAIFAASIALFQTDLKRVFAFSTVSQLGYMILGVGVLSSIGGMFHLVSHAFFKALLFMTVGSVMHALAGQLDIRKVSGLRHKMPVTAALMFCGCVSLAGVPLTAGFFSKDMIIAYTFERGLGEHGHPWYLLLGVLALVTAFLTASYAFRLWFRVFMGPPQWVMGSEHQSEDELKPVRAGDVEGEAAASAHEAPAHAQSDQPHHEPHEAPWWPMNAPLAVLAIGSLFGGLLGIVGGQHYGWIGSMIDRSTAAVAHDPGHAAPTLLGLNVHVAIMILTSVISLSAIALAAYLHWFNRDVPERLASHARGFVNLARNRYYIDELYDKVFVVPVRLGGYLLYVIDQLVVHTLVLAVGWVPRLLGHAARPAQHGRLQGYGLGMVAGVAILLVFVLLVTARA